MLKVFAFTACLYGFIAVALGAFGAHELRDRLNVGEREIEIWDTASKYLMIHGLALFAVCWRYNLKFSKLALTSGLSFMLGTLIFSGSLYLLVLLEMRKLGAITPIGGLLLLLAWLLLGISMFTLGKKDEVTDN